MRRRGGTGRLRAATAVAALSGVLAVALVEAAPAGARALPAQPPFRVLIVQDLNVAQLRSLAARGAVGMLVPGVGPTVSRRQALAALVRGEQQNARLGGVPRGPALISPTAATGTPTGHPVIVVELPPKGLAGANDRRYPIAVLGRGYRGLLTSPTTRIPGLVSIVDVAPTALAHRRGALSSRPSRDAVSTVLRLDREIHSNNRLKFPALIVVAVIVWLLALVRPRAALAAIPAALLANLALGAAGTASEPVLLGALAAATLLGALVLGRSCRSESAVLALCLLVILVHLVLLATRPVWVAVTPLGPTQNSRFWGVGNQLETLLLPLVLAGAALAGRRLGAPGFAAVGVLGLVTIAGNRFGADGGGAIVLGVSFAFLGTRLGRSGLRGLAVGLPVAATAVLGLVWLDLRAGGPDHLRSAFSHGAGGLLSVARNRVPLSYEPALHHWYLLVPFGLAFAALGVLSLLRPHPPGRRDIVAALALAVGVSLLVNDSAAYVLIGGTAGLAALGGSPLAFGPLAHLSLARPVVRVQALDPEPSAPD